MAKETEKISVSQRKKIMVKGNGVKITRSKKTRLSISPHADPLEKYDPALRSDWQPQKRLQETRNFVKEAMAQFNLEAMERDSEDPPATISPLPSTSSGDISPKHPHPVGDAQEFEKKWRFMPQSKEERMDSTRQTNG